MRKLQFIIIFFLSITNSYSQETLNTDADVFYKEDQFYAGITYNLLGKKNTDISQTGFSTGIHFGFIKDLPINKKGNVALGIGIGYSANSFNQNLLINKDNSGNVTFNILNDRNTYTKNKFSIHLVEMPFEFRWRTSTATEYNFWRIYTGFKLGYIITNTTKYIGDLGSIKHSNLKEFNAFQYGLTLSIGYNTWNVHLYYPLNSIFSKNANINSDNIDTNTIKIGLIFYLL